MSEATPSPKPETPKPTPAPKPRGGRGVKKVGFVAVLVLAAAFLLNYFGVTDFGIGEKSDGQEQKSDTTPDDQKPAPPIVTDDKAKGDGDAGILQEANLKLRLGGAGILYYIIPAKGEPISLQQASFAEAMSKLQELFEGYDVRQFDVEIDVGYKGMEKDATMDAVRAELAKIPSASKITPNQIDIK